MLPRFWGVLQGRVCNLEKKTQLFLGKNDEFPFIPQQDRAVGSRVQKSTGR